MGAAIIVYFANKTNDMETPLITWSCIAALFIAILVFNLLRAARHAAHTRRHPMVELGTEREEFFVPGDPTSANQTADDYNDD